MLSESYELTTTEDGVELPHAELPTALWGYDRDAVHEYLERVREAVSDALDSRSPDPAVRQALDQVGQETSAVLKRAHEIAEAVTVKSQADADARLEAAEQEARAIREAGERRVAELDAELERLWAERGRLLADVDRIAEDLRGVVRAADERFPGEVVEDEDLVEEEGDEDAGPDGGVGSIAAPPEGGGGELAADESVPPAAADGTEGIFGAPDSAGEGRPPTADRA